MISLDLPLVFDGVEGGNPHSIMRWSESGDQPDDGAENQGKKIDAVTCAGCRCVGTFDLSLSFVAYRANQPCRLLGYGVP